MSNKKTLILEYDDFHWKYPENCLATVNRFVEKFPNIKISLMTTAKHSNLPLHDSSDWCGSVRNHILNKNICLAIHGLIHSQEEFKYKDYSSAIISLKDAELEFERADLPFVKVFRGPHWGINQFTYKALEDLDYTHIYTHNDYKELIKPEQAIKSVIYNWNLKDNAPENESVIIGHGHTHNVCGNGIEETFDKVCKFIENNNPEFKFVNEI